jgi:hypothetical protein
MLRLAHLTPIASGSTRLVYRHPDAADVLIKVMRPEVLERHKSGPFLKQMIRGRPVKLFLREIRELLLLMALGESPWFLQAVTGIAETDIGPGLIVEALRGRDGKLAPSLVDVIGRREFDASARQDLDRFVRALSESGVVLCAVSPTNVLYASDDVRGSRFVLIDGFGDRSYLPLKGLRWVRQRAKARQLAWFSGEVERLLREPSSRTVSSKARRAQRRGADA